MRQVDCWTALVRCSVLAVISGSFDHEVAVNILTELSSFCVQIRHTPGRTTASLYPLCVYCFYIHVLRLRFTGDYQVVVSYNSM